MDLFFGEIKRINAKYGLVFAIIWCNIVGNARRTAGYINVMRLVFSLCFFFIIDYCFESSFIYVLSCF